MGHDEMGDEVESSYEGADSVMREPTFNPEDPDDVLIEEVHQEGTKENEHIEEKDDL